MTPVNTATESAALSNFDAFFQDGMDRQYAQMVAQPQFFGPFDQDKYDETLRKLRERRAELETGGKVCDATGEHVWGAIERSGGLCASCDGDGLDHNGEYRRMWTDCETCNGLGFTPTEYSRRCERCGFNETRST